MSMISIRSAQPRDREAIGLVEEHAFGQPAESGLVDALVTGGDAVLELVAEEEGHVVGHILFSRLHVVEGRARHGAFERRAGSVLVPALGRYSHTRGSCEYRPRAAFRSAPAQT